jgi:hypothetical protein
MPGAPGVLPQVGRPVTDGGGMEQMVEVVGWYAAPVASYHERAWSTWLHGKVAAVRTEERLLLVVPMATLTPAATALALHLFHLGSYDVLGEAATSAA